MSNRNIATRLGISEATVKAHVTHLLRKRGVVSRLQLALAAREDGLLSTPAATALEVAESASESTGLDVG